MKLGHEFKLFAIGGLLGLVIDAGIVQVLVSFVHVNPYIAKIISFFPAATATWWWNRSHTFAARHSGRSLAVEWLHWVVLMSGGAGVNYLTYWGCLKTFSGLAQWPGVASAIGSIVAASVNFAGARLLLFTRSKTHS
jgi:putative flippase GtrA